MVEMAAAAAHQDRLVLVKTLEMVMRRRADKMVVEVVVVQMADLRQLVLTVL